MIARAVFVVCLILASGVFVFSMPRQGYINCSLAEISPDFTPAMKLKCRDYK